MVLLRFQDKKWMEVDKSEKKETDLYLDRHLKKCLDHYKELQRKDNDVLLIIYGDEGSGKSSLMGNILEYMSDGEFDPKKDLIGSDYLDGLEKIQKTKTGGWLGFDEGNTFFLATETMKKEHRDLHKIFSIFRQKRLFVAVCLPSFFRLGTYFAIDRSACAIRTYCKGTQRSFFKFYGRKRKDKLYRVGKAHYNDKAVSPNFRGRFTKCCKLENEEYKKFKAVTLDTEIEKARQKIKKPRTETEIKQELVEEIIKNNMDVANVSLKDVVGLSPARVGQLKKKIRKEQSKDFSLKWGYIDDIRGR